MAKLPPRRIVENLIPKSLYHYTTQYGQQAIINSGVLRPSLKKKNGRDVLFGEGQYFTDIAPEMVVCRSTSQMTDEQKQSGKLSLLQLSYNIMRTSVAIEKVSCFIEFDVSDLNIKHSTDYPDILLQLASEYPYTYLHESILDLNIEELIISSGRTLV